MLNIDNLELLLSKRDRYENIQSCLEELCEFQTAVLRRERNRDKNTDNILEEMADTLIVTHMLRLMYGISEEQLKDEIDRKMKRNLDRIQTKGGDEVN